MSSYIGIVILCVLPGILAGTIHILLSKKRQQAVSPAKTIVFYAGIFYGALSFIKLVFDGGWATMAESFQDILPATYLHYMLPILFLVIAIPLLSHLFLRRIDMARFMSLFDSLMFAILALGFVISGKICHFLYIGSMVVSILVSFTGTCFYQGEISYCSRDTFRQRILYAIPASLFYTVTVILSLPGTLFLNNRAEIPVVFSSFARALAVGFCTYFLILAAAGALLLTWRQLELFYTALFALTLAGYLQNIFLNGHMMSMDGKMQSWKGPQAWGNALLWFALIAGIMLLKIFLHKNVGKAYRMVCIYLSLVQAVSLGYLAISTSLSKDGSEESTGEWILSTQGALKLHPDHNVLVFILDWYDQQILEQILAEEPDFLAPLDGFTYYPNATSLYAFTSCSLPYLLTGVPWQYNMEDKEYREYAFHNSDLISDIRTAGYNIGLYTSPTYIGNEIGEELCNYVLSEQYCRIWDTVGVMLKCSKYQMAPFFLKNNYWYTTDEIYALARNDEYTKWPTYDDVPFYQAVTETGISIDQHSKEQGCYRFYHLNGAHEPYRMSEDCTSISEQNQAEAMVPQAKGSMKIVFEYIRQLQELGLYDNTTIIITADHGQNYIYDPERASSLPGLGLENTSNPILLVKNAGDSQNGIKQSNAPVSHTEMIASMMYAVDPQTAGKYGERLEEIAQDAQRERIFTFMRNDMPYVKVAITGNVRETDSWSILEEIP